jgi:hypothetical protein
MPTKRVPRYREHIGRISPEAVRLFATLETTPKRLRKSEQFRKDERRLAEMLDCGREWWSGAFSIDCCSRRKNPFRPWQGAYADWAKCKGIRELLLVMCTQERRSAPRGLSGTPTH